LPLSLLRFSSLGKGKVVAGLRLIFNPFYAPLVKIEGEQAPLGHVPPR
jgi:hypothetical protein